MYVRYSMTPSQLRTRLLFNYNCNDIWWHMALHRCGWNICNTIRAMEYACALVLMLIEYILRIYYKTILCWLWTDRAYVGISACLNLNMSWLGVQSTMTPSDLHTCLILNYNRNGVLFMVDYIYCVYIMERYRVGFGRTGRTLVLVHVWIWMCYGLVTIRHDIIAIAYPLAIQTHNNGGGTRRTALRGCRFRLNTYLANIWTVSCWISS